MFKIWSLWFWSEIWVEEYCVRSIITCTVKWLFLPLPFCLNVFVFLSIFYVTTIFLVPVFACSWQLKLPFTHSLFHWKMPFRGSGWIIIIVAEMLYSTLDKIATNKYTTLHEPIWSYNQNLVGSTLLLLLLLDDTNTAVWLLNDCRVCSNESDFPSIPQWLEELSSKMEPHMNKLDWKELGEVKQKNI